MNTYTDRAVSIGSAVAIVLFLSALIYSYPETVTVGISHDAISFLNILCISPLSEGKAEICTWTVLLIITVSVFGFLYLFGAVRSREQYIDGVHSFVHTSIMILVFLLLLVASTERTLFYVELTCLLSSFMLTIFLVHKGRYQKNYLQYFLLYGVTVFFGVLGAAYALFPLFELVLFACIATFFYTLFFWSTSMSLIFIREFATV